MHAAYDLTGPTGNGYPYLDPQEVVLYSRVTVILWDQVFA